jgi:hypothetical protein
VVATTDHLEESTFGVFESGLPEILKTPSLFGVRRLTLAESRKEHHSTWPRPRVMRDWSLIYKLLSATELTLAMSDNLGSSDEHLARRMVQFRKPKNL